MQNNPFYTVKTTQLFIDNNGVCENILTNNFAVSQDRLLIFLCDYYKVCKHTEILKVKFESIEIQLGVLVDVVSDKNTTFDIRCEFCVVIEECQNEPESNKKPLEFYSSGYKESYICNELK